MKRMAKPEGRGNVVLEDAPIPEPGYGQVRVKAVRSLISRGSEIGRRYVLEEAVDPQIMGYSMAGVVDALGEGVQHLAIGDRVGAVAPHAQYVVGRRHPRAPGQAARNPPALPQRHLGPGPLLDAQRLRRALDRHRPVPTRQRHRRPRPGPRRQPHPPGHARHRRRTPHRHRRRPAPLRACRQTRRRPRRQRGRRRPRRRRQAPIRRRRR